MSHFQPYKAIPVNIFNFFQLPRFRCITTSISQNLKNVLFACHHSRPFVFPQKKVMEHNIHF